MKKPACILTVLFFIFFGLTAEDRASYEPAALTASTEGSVLLYLTKLPVGVTALKTNETPQLSIKTADARDFRFVKFTIDNVLEALTKDKKVVTYKFAHFTLKDSSLAKVNSLIKSGSLDFDDLMDNILDSDLDVTSGGSEKAPKPSDFSQLRKAFFYNITAEDADKKQIQLQLIVENFTDSDKLK